MSHTDPTASSFDSTIDAPTEGRTLNGLTSEPGETDLAEVAQGAEPTTDARGAIALAPQQPLEPLPPLPKLPPQVITRTVSGRYGGTLGSFRVELRVDVDRSRPLRKVSGDFYSTSGGTTSYIGSFVVDTVAIVSTPAQITLRGLGRFGFSAGAPVVQVTIARRSIFQPAAPATLQFFTTGGAPGSTYACQFQSTYFRSVFLETDRVSNVTTPVFSSYNTGSLPSGGVPRTLSVASAYGEAGIEMISTAGSDVINIAEAKAGATWSDAELHASMVKHFSMFKDQPQWAVWQVACQLHDLGPNLLGIMFDQAGSQRQGCAVFHAGLGGTTPEQLRLQLYTYVHELGHCFNLLHSWQKSLANPPGVDRPASLSYMNYPWRFPGGPAAYWNGFAFQFDDAELVHLRHAFRNNIVMGGSPFAVGSAVIDPDIMADAVEDNSGLEFDIAPSHHAYALGEPVVLKMALRAADRRGRTVHPNLHPKTSMTTVAIAKPNGEVVAYEPYMDHLMATRPEHLVEGRVIEDSAYIGFGKGGLYFEQPGTYRIRAIYHAPDGSRVMSNVVSLRVRYPVTSKEQDLAELLMGDEQGALFYLLGSDSEFLSHGNEAFKNALYNFGDQPVTDYVRLAVGTNLSRTFKTVDDRAGNRVHVRDPEIAEAASLITSATAVTSPIDSLSKVTLLERLAKKQTALGDEQGAAASLSQVQAVRGARRP